MTEQRSNREKFFDALDESFEALLDAVRSGNERGYRFSRRLVNEAEQAQRDLIHLGRRFARQPRDVRGLYQSSVELARRGVSNSVLLTREWMDGAQEARRDVRETARKVIRANRTAAQALGAAVQATATDLVQSASERASGRPAPSRRPTARRRVRRVVRRPTGDQE